MGKPFLMNDAKVSGIFRSEYIIELSSKVMIIELSEPRMSQVDIRIIGDDKKTRWFRDHTPIAEALRKRQVSQAAVYVMTTPGSEKIVARIAEEYIFS